MIDLAIILGIFILVWFLNESDLRWFQIAIRWFHIAKWPLIACAIIFYIFTIGEIFYFVACIGALIGFSYLLKNTIDLYKEKLTEKIKETIAEEMKKNSRN